MQSPIFTKNNCKFGYYRHTHAIRNTLMMQALVMRLKHFT